MIKIFKNFGLEVPNNMKWITGRKIQENHLYNKKGKKLKQKEKMQLEGGRERKGKFPILSLSF